MTSRGEAQIAEMALAVHPVATLVVDLNGRVSYSNDSARKAFGLDPRDAHPTKGVVFDWQSRRMPLTDLLGTAADSSNWIPAVFSRDGETVHARMRGIRGVGSHTPKVLITLVEHATTPFVIHAQQIQELNTQLALYQKIAGELEESVRISKLLERELVHRVKNNLAVISALLNQQARSAEDQVVKDALKGAASRIKSIAVVHDILDTNHESEAVELNEMIKALVGGISDALCPKHIQIVTEIESIKAHVDVALPLALLINELVTNAIKHAFVDRNSGCVEVLCSARGASIDIRVVDNGIGMPEAGILRPRTVTALAEQMGGTIDCRVADGTEWTIRIPIDAGAKVSRLTGASNAGWTDKTLPRETRA